MKAVLVECDSCFVNLNYIILKTAFLILFNWLYGYFYFFNHLFGALNKGFYVSLQNSPNEFAQAVYDELGVKLTRNLEQSRTGGHDLTVAGGCPISRRLAWYAIEVKRYHQVTDAKINKWWSQAVVQAQNADLVPMLAFRGDRQAWRIVLPLAVVSDLLPGKYPELPWTAWLSLEAFAALVRESSL